MIPDAIEHSKSRYPRSRVFAPKSSTRVYVLHWTSWDALFGFRASKLRVFLISSMVCIITFIMMTVLILYIYTHHIMYIIC